MEYMGWQIAHIRWTFIDINETIRLENFSELFYFVDVSPGLIDSLLECGIEIGMSALTRSFDEWIPALALKRFRKCLENKQG